MRILILMLMMAAVAIAVANIVRQWRAQRQAPTDATGTLPYRKTDTLLSASERSFFEVLSEAVGHQYFVFPKVRLADLVCLPPDAEHRQAHMERVASRQVDFVLCEPEKLKPVLIVQLDDQFHVGEDRPKRDAFVDETLVAAGLAVLHVPAQKTYPPNELAALVGKTLAGKTE